MGRARIVRNSRRHPRFRPLTTTRQSRHPISADVNEWFHVEHRRRRARRPPSRTRQARYFDQIGSESLEGVASQYGEGGSGVGCLPSAEFSRIPHVPSARIVRKSQLQSPRDGRRKVGQTRGKATLGPSWGPERRYRYSAIDIYGLRSIYIDTMADYDSLANRCFDKRSGREDPPGQARLIQNKKSSQFSPHRSPDDDKRNCD